MYFALWLKIDVVSMFCPQKLTGVSASCDRHPLPPSARGGLTILNNSPCFLNIFYEDESNNLGKVSFERYLDGEHEL